MFELDVPSGAKSFDWIASVSAGTSITFLMVDSEGRSGGSSNLRTVDQSTDTSCLNASSPHSTAGASSTATSIVAPSATQTVEVKQGSNTGTIVGGILGGLALLLLVLLGALLCLRRRKQSSGSGWEDKYQVNPAIIGTRGTSRVSRAFRPRGGRAPPSLDLLHSSSRSLHQMPNRPLSDIPSVPSIDDYALPNPYILPSTNVPSVGHSTQYHSTSVYNAHSPHSLISSTGHSAQHYPPSLYNIQTLQSVGTGATGVPPISPLSLSRTRSESEGPRSPISVLSNPYSTANHHGHSRRPSMPYSVISGRSGKTSGVGTGHTTPRLILHTDADDPNPDSEDEVVELPPQYSDRRIGVPLLPNEKERPPPTPPPPVP